MRRRQVIGAALGCALGASGCEKNDPRRIDLWFSYGGKNRETLLALVDQFNRTQEEVRVHAVFQGDYFELLAKLRTAMHAASVPAVTHVVGEVLPYLVGAGVLERLDAYPELSGDLDLVPQLSQQGAFLDDGARGLYGVPFNRSTPIAYFNGNVLDELAGKPPTTWDELRDFARAATRRDGRFGYTCPIDWWFWVALTGQAGGNVVAPDGTITLGGDAGVRALKLWREMAAEGSMRIPPGRDYNAWQVTNTDFLEGKVASIWSSTAFVRYLEQNAKFPVVAAPLPRDQRFSVPTGGTMFVVPKAARDADKAKAARFIAFMAAAPQALTFATKTGYIPVSKGALATLDRDGYYEKFPNDRVAVRQLMDVSPWPWLPDLFRLQREIVQPRIEAAIVGGVTPKVALAEARAAYAEGS